MNRVLRFFFFLLFPFTLITCTPYENEFNEFPWLIRVSTTYQDSKNPQKSYTFRGYGFLIEALGQYYVMTASHLSQGGITENNANLTLEYYDKEFIPLQHAVRLAHNRRDVEIIRVEVPVGKKLEPLARWITPDSSLQGHGLGFEEANEFKNGKLQVIDKWANVLLKDNELHPRGYTPLGLNTFLPKVKILSDTLVTPFENSTYTQALDLAKKYDSPALHHRIASGIDLLSEEVFAHTKLKPGMSGLPLFLRTKNYDTQESQVLIGGLAVSGSRYFSSSWLVSESVLNLVLAKLTSIYSRMNSRDVEGPLLIENVYWRCRDGMTYREGTLDDLHSNGVSYTLHFKEALFKESAATGGLEQKETGNGERGDGGRDETVIVGNGERGDGGRDETISVGDSERSEGNANSQFKLPPSFKLGMGFSLTEKGNAPSALKTIQAFELNLNSNSYLLPAEMSSLNWLLNHVYGGKFKAIEETDDLAALIWNRWKQHYALEAAATTYTGTATLETLLPFASYSSAEIKIKIDYEKNPLSKLKINIDLGFDKLSFELGNRGEIAGVSESFQNNVKVKSEKGEEYSLDLADMLMTAISKMTYKTQLNDRGRLQFKIRNTKNEMLIWKNIPWKKRSF